MGLGGCLGSVLRYLLSLVPLDRTGSFPVNTLLTNVLGAFAIGLLAALSRQSGLDSRLVLFLKTGVCGGFTTFSTFALETTGLLQSGRYLPAALYVLLSLGLSLAAVFLAESF